MPHMMQPGDRKPNNPGTASVAVRLGQRWRMQPHSAKWKVYSMERGIRGEALEVIRAMQPAQAQAWLQPLIEAATAGKPAPISEALARWTTSLSDVMAHGARFLFLDPSPKNRKDWVDQLRRLHAALGDLIRSYVESDNA